MTTLYKMLVAMNWTELAKLSDESHSDLSELRERLSSLINEGRSAGRSAGKLRWECEQGEEHLELITQALFDNHQACLENLKGFELVAYKAAAEWREFN